jgi:hypothetical protein
MHPVVIPIVLLDPDPARNFDSWQLPDLRGCFLLVNTLEQVIAILPNRFSQILAFLLCSRQAIIFETMAVTLHPFGLHMAG